MPLRVVIIFLCSYLLGNLNGSILISKTFSHDDVRSHGSGNAGFTNFYRNYGGIGSILVILIDAVKAVAACLLGGYLLKPYGLSLEGTALAAAAVGLGHDFPALLGFKGGKGIVCGFTSACVLDWRVAIVAFFVFAIIYFSTKFVSLSSILGAATVGICFLLWNLDHPWACAGCIFMCALAIIMHRDNIGRLMHGTERKTDFFKKEKHS